MVIKNQEKIYIINLIIFYKYKDFPKKVFQEKDTTEKRLLSKNWVNDNLLIIKNIKILSFKNKCFFWSFVRQKQNSLKVVNEYNDYDLFLKILWMIQNLAKSRY